jgi:hypothetical protein
MTSSADGPIGLEWEDSSEDRRESPYAGRIRNVRLEART